MKFSNLFVLFLMKTTLAFDFQGNLIRDLLKSDRTISVLSVVGCFDTGTRFLRKKKTIFSFKISST